MVKMKVLSILPLALAASAFVIPDPEMQESLLIQNQEQESSHPFWDNIQSPEKIWEELEERFNQAAGGARHKLHSAVDYVHDTAVSYGENLEHAFAGEAWLRSADQELDLFEDDHPPPHHPPHRRPHHPPHHQKPNKTVYELIAESKYTTKLAKAIGEFPDLVELLNNTQANYTVFAPTDKAFEKIPEKAPKPPKEFLKKLLTYHVSPQFYPAGRVLVTRTIPTALLAEYIGNNPQRLSTQIGLKGLTVNFYSRIVAVDIFGTNGVIHGVDSILIPPPKVIDIISYLPGDFSTLELGLRKTGLYEHFNDTSLHEGGTLFAPSNFAFKLLGSRINGFLFSKYGEKYLKALLLYHSVADITLYSDAIYKAEKDDHPPHHGPPRGFYHIDLPTGLEGKSLSVDVARYGRLITIKINGFSRVSVLDGVAADGVIQVVPNVLIPPKTPGEHDGIFVAGEMDLEEFKQRLEPLIESEEEYEWEL